MKRLWFPALSQQTTPLFTKVTLHKMIFIELMQVPLNIGRFCNSSIRAIRIKRHQSPPLNNHFAIIFNIWCLVILFLCILLIFLCYKNRLIEVPISKTLITKIHLFEFSFRIALQLGRHFLLSKASLP